MEQRLPDFQGQLHQIVYELFRSSGVTGSCASVEYSSIVSQLTFSQQRSLNLNSASKLFYPGPCFRLYHAMPPFVPLTQLTCSLYRTDELNPGSEVQEQISNTRNEPRSMRTFSSSSTSNRDVCSVLTNDVNKTEWVIGPRPRSAKLRLRVARW